MDDESYDISESFIGGNDIKSTIQDNPYVVLTVVVILVVVIVVLLLRMRKKGEGILGMGNKYAGRANKNCRRDAKNYHAVTPQLFQHNNFDWQEASPVAVPEGKFQKGFDEDDEYEKNPDFVPANARDEEGVKAMSDSSLFDHQYLGN